MPDKRPYARLMAHGASVTITTVTDDDCAWSAVRTNSEEAIWEGNAREACPHSAIRSIVEVCREATPSPNHPTEGAVLDAHDLGLQLITGMVVSRNPAGDREI